MVVINNDSLKLTDVDKFISHVEEKESNVRDIRCILMNHEVANRIFPDKGYSIICFRYKGFLFMCGEDYPRNRLCTSFIEDLQV